MYAYASLTVNIATLLWHGNIAIANVGRHIMISAHLITDNTMNRLNSYFPQNMDQFINTHAKRIDF